MPSTMTDSPQSWDLIRQWLKQCTEHHDRCNASGPSAPIRLLDISTAKENYIQLVESQHCEDFGKPYATLSHCWGKLPFLLTRPENISQHKRQILLSQLTKSFRDGIYIARTLGLRYLWIDSLCIIQESSDDWIHEGAKMDEYYRYGHVNIAVAGASNGTEGCFWERNPRTVLSTVFSVRWMNSNGCTTRRYQVVPDSNFWSRKLLNQPLHQRGWILQERILAPRVLNFGRDQLHWKC